MQWYTGYYVNNIELKLSVSQSIIYAPVHNCISLTLSLSKTVSVDELIRLRKFVEAEIFLANEFSDNELVGYQLCHDGQ